jgi:hypothetical protein
MKRKLLGLIACVALVAPAQAATYNIDFVDGVYTISGSITTNGTSPVAAADISAYSLSFINTGSTIFTLTNSNAAPSTPLINGSDLTTTSTTISFNFGDGSAPGSAFFQGSGADSADSIGFYNKFSADLTTGEIEIGTPGNADILLYPSGDVVLGSVSTTPLPAAFPLFGTALGMMGLLGWRRKRKDTAVAT